MKSEFLGEEGIVELEYTEEEIVEAEDGEEFQEYVYEDGTRVKAGTPIGIERKELYLFKNIRYSGVPFNLWK